MTITNDFQTILDKSNCQTSKIFIDKGRKFYNRSLKSWLKTNDIEIHQFIFIYKTLSIYIYIKIYKHITSTLTNVHIDQLDDKYNNTYYRTIKMKLVDVKLSMYIY